MDELEKAIRQGKPNKAQGRDGICKAKWGTVQRDLLNIMCGGRRRLIFVFRMWRLVVVIKDGG